MKTKTVAILGAGNRGMDVYGELIKKRDDLKVVAVAEKDKIRREKIAKEHSIPPIKQFKNWEDLLIEDKLADGIIISTGDKEHFEPLIKSLKKGYKVLCEKPITDSFENLTALYNDYKNYSNDVMVSHVLRYTPFFRKIKEIITSEEIGSVRFVSLIENIGFFHFAHSYVRGNWRNKEVGAPIILAKSCHDLDILYLLFES
jgi:predicted dehydrogenase